MRLLKDHPGQGPAHLQSLGDQSWSWEHPYRDFPWTNDSDWVIHPVQSSDLGPLLFGPLICPFLESFFFLSSLGCVTKLEPEGPWNLSRMWNKKKHVSLISSESLPPPQLIFLGTPCAPSIVLTPWHCGLGGVPIISGCPLRVSYCGCGEQSTLLFRGRGNQPV